MSSADFLAWNDFIKVKKKKYIFPIELFYIAARDDIVERSKKQSSIDVQICTGKRYISIFPYEFSQISTTSYILNFYEDVG